MLGGLLGPAGHAVATVAASGEAAAATGSGGYTAAAPAGELRLAALVNGRAVGDGRLLIDPARPAEVTVTVVNGTPAPVRATGIELSGEALGLTLFGYRTPMVMDVPPGAAVSRSYPLPLAGLHRQATGLLPASVRLLGPDGAVLAEVGATAEVRGSVWSVYGVFWIAVVIVSALAWAGLLAALWRPGPPAGRWRRPEWSVPAGACAGVSIVVTLSVLRLVPPTPAVEIALVLGGAMATLALSSLLVSPHPMLDGPMLDGPLRDGPLREYPSEDRAVAGATNTGDQVPAGAMAGEDDASAAATTLDFGERGMAGAEDAETTRPVSLTEELLASGEEELLASGEEELLASGEEELLASGDAELVIPRGVGRARLRRPGPLTSAGDG